MAQVTAKPNGNYWHLLDVWDTGMVSGLSRLIHGKYIVDVRVSGSAGSWSGSNTRLFRVWADGQNYDNRMSFDTRNGADFVTVEFDKWVYVGSSSKTINFSLHFEGWSASFPAATSGTGTLTLAAVATAPSQPPAPVASNVTETGMTLSWNDPASSGGAGYDQVILRRHPAPPTGTSGGYTDYVMGGDANSKVVNGLTPGTAYYWQLHYHNAAGYSPHGAVLAQPTATGAPPGISVTSDPSGLSAVVNLTPPSGMSGVTEYNIQVDESGTVSTASTTTTTRTVTGLAPGATVRWRANAEIGSYTSPWSAWLTQVQPSPNTSAGDFFDGNTADRTDVTYDWVGASGASKSEAHGVGAQGWGANFTAPAAGTMHFSTGGRSPGSHSARVTITRDATAAGQVRGGLRNNGFGRVDVVGLATYANSLWFYPSRSQRVALEVVYFDGAGDEIGTRLIGSEVVAPANTRTRLWAVGLTPAGAESMLFRALDVAGTGHSVWLAGEWFTVDDAMSTLGSERLPFFNGSYPDTPEYQYDWLGTPHESQSSRTTLVVETIDPLADPDCPPTPAPPLPPEIVSDCIVEVGGWNRYTVDIDGADVPLWGATVPSLIIHTAGAAERQVRIRFYANPDDLEASGLDTTTGWDAELILTYIPPNADITLDGVTQRVWAEVAGAAPRTADQLLYGTGGTPATWPVLRCGIGYVVTLDTPLEAPAGNLSTRVLLTQRV